MKNDDTLPSALGTIREMATSVPEPATGAKRARLLVVDDEPTVCATVQRMLSGEHDTVTVPTAKEVLRLVGEGRPFDLILCDLMMPEVTGMDLHAELQRTAPEQAARIAFMTGGTFT